MKIKRVATVKTFKKYENELKKLIPAYLKKSQCRDTAEDVLVELKSGCHNPFFLTCIIENASKIVGFVSAQLMVEHKGKYGIINHFYTPVKQGPKIYNLIAQRMCEDFELELKNLAFLTYRNPDAWVRITKRHNVEHEVVAWVLQRKDV